MTGFTQRRDRARRERVLCPLLRYQHAAADRDKVIAEALSALATTSK